MAPYGLQIWYSEPADKYFVLLDVATASVYVVDVDGKRQVFLTQVAKSTSAADRAELQTVLDSIRIEGPSSTQEPSLTSTAPAADGSIYFAADTRGGEALTDPVSAGQAEFHPKPSDIYLSRRGDPVRRVVATDGSDRCPRVSPDGEHLAYLQDSTLVVAPLDAAGNPGAPRVRTHLPASPSECPQWSPDGDRVGYVAFVGERTVVHGPTRRGARRDARWPRPCGRRLRGTDLARAGVRVVSGREGGCLHDRDRRMAGPARRRGRAPVATGGG